MSSLIHDGPTPITTTTTTPLPDILSDMILLALDDLRACAEDPQYTINMGVWYYRGPFTCYVCLAGAVMAQRFIDLPADTEVNPMFLSQGHKFEALNHARCGDLDWAIQRFYGGTVEVPKTLWGSWSVPAYGEDCTGFYATMHQIVEALRGVGL